jgi:hypothetical protein
MRIQFLTGSLLAVSFLMMACPDGTADPNQNTSSDGGSGNGGGNSDGSNQIDLGCELDDQCGTGEICDMATGECVAGYDCSLNPGICNFCSDPGDVCGTGTAQTYCDEEAGVCRRTRGTCDPCDVDEQCGAGQSFPNQCIDGRCAEGCGSTCVAGFACESGGCVPVETAGSCDTAILCRNGETCPDGEQCSDLGVCLSICTEDSECGAGQICSLDPGPLLGQCIQGCIEGQTIISGTETLICHADGRYGPLCDTPGSSDGCPEGLECEDDGHCGLTGCQTSEDCPVVRTYCDTDSGECVAGCQSEDDCAAFELCEENVCVAQGCRGKDVSCGLGQWCCGEELYETEECPTDVLDGDCFLAPDPWCRVCEGNDDCADINSFNQTSYCYELQQEDDQGNTSTLGKFCSVGCDSDLDCPRGLPCLELPTDQEGVTVKGCLDSLCAPIVEAREASQ